MIIFNNRNNIYRVEIATNHLASSSALGWGDSDLISGLLVICFVGDAILKLKFLISQWLLFTLIKKIVRESLQTGN